MLDVLAARCLEQGDASAHLCARPVHTRLVDIRVLDAAAMERVLAALTSTAVSTDVHTTTPQTGMSCASDPRLDQSMDVNAPDLAAADLFRVVSSAEQPRYEFDPERGTFSRYAHVWMIAWGYTGCVLDCLQRER